MNKTILILGIVLLSLFLAGCQKDINGSVGGISNVAFIIEDVLLQEEQGDQENASKAPDTRENSSYVFKQLSQTSYQDQDGGSIVVKEELMDKNSIQNVPNLGLKGGSRTSGQGNMAIAPVYPDNYVPASPMFNKLPAGVKFRILIYDKAGTFIEQVDGTSGSSSSPTAVNLNQGKDYNYYAYSYYSNDPLPPVNNTANPTFNVENEDFIYTSGTFKTAVQSGAVSSTPVKIQFKHAMAMIQIQSYVTGHSGKADLSNFLSNNASRPYIRANANMLKKGVFNLKAQNFESSSFINTPVYANSRANYAFESNTPATSYQGFFYTVPGRDDESTSFVYTVESWVLQDRPTNPLVLNKSYTDAVRIGRGKFSRISIWNFDVGILVPANGGTAAAYWSRGDLYYDTSQGFSSMDGFMRFQHRNYEANSIYYGSSFQAMGVLNPTATYGQAFANYGSTYFPFRKSYPNGGPQSSTYSDPCNSLMPNTSNFIGKWKMPTTAQGKALAEYITNYANTGRLSTNESVTPGRQSLLVIANMKEPMTNERLDRIAFEMKGFAELKSGSTTQYQMNPSSYPTVTGTKKGSVSYWLDNGGNTVFAYLQITVDDSKNPRITARVHRSDVTTGSTKDGYYPVNLKSTDAINIRCIRTK